MTEIEELLARDQIRQLAERYAVAVDGKDLDTLAGLFAADVANGRYGVGRAGVKLFYDNVLRPFHCSMHMVGNHIIDFDDNNVPTVLSTAEPTTTCSILSIGSILRSHIGTRMSVSKADDFRRRQLKSWYRQEFGYPDHGTDRVLSDRGESGPERGEQCLKRSRPSNRSGSGHLRPSRAWE